MLSIEAVLGFSCEPNREEKITIKSYYKSFECLSAIAKRHKHTVSTAQQNENDLWYTQVSP